MLCSQKYDLNWGLQQLRKVWTQNFKTSPAEEDDVEMTGDGEGLGEPSPDEDDFEKQMRLANESDKTEVTESEPHHLKHRLISLRGDFWKNQFRYLE